LFFSAREVVAVLFREKASVVELLLSSTHLKDDARGPAFELQDRNNSLRGPPEEASSFAFPVQVSMLRHPLCLNHEFGGQQALHLVLRRVGAIDDVAYKLRTKGER